jgi:hypothetical protein
MFHFFQLMPNGLAMPCAGRVGTKSVRFGMHKAIAVFMD